jgi:NTP pyrophosphatase (non-canonical NTP hydrolase)
MILNSYPVPFDQAAFVESMQLFQVQWAYWMNQCYPQNVINDPQEARLRFAEEAFELMQAVGMTKDEVMFMLGYVYGREKGESAQEAAGTLNCLATLCNLHKIDLGKAAIDDLQFCWENLDKIRYKQSQKPKYRDQLQPAEDPK